MGVQIGAYSAASVPASTGVMDPVPSDWYTMMIVSDEDKEISNNKGRLLNQVWQICEGMYAGRKVYHNLNLWHIDDEVKGRSWADLSQQLNAIGLPQIQQNTAEMHNKPCRVKVKFSPAKGEYEANNRLTAFRTMNDPQAVSTAKPALGAPPVPGAAPVPPMAQQAFPPVQVPAMPPAAAPQPPQGYAQPPVVYAQQPQAPVYAQQPQAYAQPPVQPAYAQQPPAPVATAPQAAPAPVAGLPAGAPAPWQPPAPVAQPVAQPTPPVQMQQIDPAAQVAYQSQQLAQAQAQAAQAPAPAAAVPQVPPPWAAPQG